MEFAGFPPGVQATPVPDPVLGVLLQQIDDLAELKVTLRGFWLAHQKKGALRAIPQEEFLHDQVLVRGLGGRGDPPQEAILRGLDLAVQRHTFLVLPSNSAKPDCKLYFINAEGDRRALQRLHATGAVPTPEDIEPATADGAAGGSKPNIFVLYENNIGTISPMLAEQLKEAEEVYPASWISDAFKIAVDQNARSWAYISAILRRWTDEGKDDGESGRHSQKDNRTNYLEEYRQLRGHLPWESRDR